MHVINTFKFLFHKVLSAFLVYNEKENETFLDNVNSYLPVNTQRGEIEICT